MFYSYDPASVHLIRLYIHVQFSLCSLKRFISEPKAQVSQGQEGHEQHKDKRERADYDRKTIVQDTHF